MALSLPVRHRSVAAKQTAPRHQWLLVACIIAASAALSTYWVFLVPIFESPDENIHADYAFSLYSAGRLINLREPWLPWNSHPTGTRFDRDLVFHVYTLYLTKATDVERIQFNPQVMAPKGYGTAGFFAALDRDAPDQ